MMTLVFNGHIMAMINSFKYVHYYETSKLWSVFVKIVGTMTLLRYIFDFTKYILYLKIIL